MNELIDKLKRLGLAESAVLQVTMRRLSRNTAMLAVVVGLVLLTIVMLNVAVFLQISETTSQSTAAFVVAGGNAVLAALLFFFARQDGPSREESLARDIRDRALQDLDNQLEETRSAFRSGSGLVSSLSLLGPLFEWGFDTMRRRRK